MTTTITIKEHCRVCSSKMTDVLSLGDIVPVDFIKDGEIVRESAPLTLAECGQCHLVQLRHTCHRDTLFRQYWYLSGLNPSMVASLKDVVDGAVARVDLSQGDVVVDIGANDGTLLSLYPSFVHKIGFDPATNLAEQAAAICDEFYNDYFESASIPTDSAKIITSIAMFYDLDSPRDFILKICKTLRRDGIWVMQMTDLVRMLRANAFDNICHEHLCYYPFGVFKALVEEYGLQVFDVEFNDVNGASIRCYVSWADARPIQPSVSEALLDEDAYLADGAIAKFAAFVESAKQKTVAFIRQEREQGKIFHALGASTKGNTLLQFYGLNNEDIMVAAEVNPDKYGLVMAGSNVPIVPQHQSLACAPDYYLVLPWHFIDFFLRKQAGYLEAGGVLLAPLPHPKLHHHDHATDL